MVSQDGVDVGDENFSERPIAFSDYAKEDFWLSDPDTHINSGKQLAGPDRVTYVTDPLNQRGVVQKVVVQPGDNLGRIAEYLQSLGIADFGREWQSGTGEVCMSKNFKRMGTFTDGDTVVVSFGVSVDSNFSSPNGDWNNFVSIHSGGAVRVSPFSLHLVGDTPRLKVKVIGGGDFRKSLEDEPPTVFEWVDLGVFPKNEWQDFIAEVHLSSAGGGSVRLWWNGNLAVDLQNRAVGYADEERMYYLQGFYREAFSKTTELWFSDIYKWDRAENALLFYGWDQKQVRAPKFEATRSWTPETLPDTADPVLWKATSAETSGVILSAEVADNPVVLVDQGQKYLHFTGLKSPGGTVGTSMGINPFPTGQAKTVVIFGRTNADDKAGGKSKLPPPLFSNGSFDVEQGLDSDYVEIPSYFRDRGRLARLYAQRGQWHMYAWTQDTDGRGLFGVDDRVTWVDRGSGAREATWISLARAVDASDPELEGADKTRIRSFDTLEIHTSPDTYTAEDLAALWKTTKAKYPELNWAPENQQPGHWGP